MPKPLDRVYELEQKFSFFPNPQFKKIYFATAFASPESNSSPQPFSENKDDHVSVKSNFGIKVPFSEHPIPLRANLATISDPRSTEFPPPVHEDGLLFDVHNMGSDLFGIGLMQFSHGPGAITHEYDPEIKAKFERLGMIVDTEAGRRFSFPHVEIYYQSALNYTRFLPLGEALPTMADFERFKQTPKLETDRVRIDRDLRKIGELQGMFFSVSP